MSSIEELRSQFEKSVEDLNDRFDVASEKITAGDDLAPGVLKMVKKAVIEDTFKLNMPNDK